MVKNRSDKSLKKPVIIMSIVVAVLLAIFFTIVGVSNCSKQASQDDKQDIKEHQVDASQQQQNKEAGQKEKIDAAFAKLNLSTDMRASLAHGPKGAQYQKYIVLHDTEGDGLAKNVISGWDANGKGVAAQFVVNKDGTIWQCVPIDQIAHHAGFGDTGHNAAYGVSEDGRDDKRGTTPVGSWASDYGMNAWSVGIEIVHVGGSGPYPEAQLQAIDNLIAYIDAYYWNSPSGNGGTIIDHKMWRTGNSDTSKEFATYLENYKTKRTHK